MKVFDTDPEDKVIVFVCGYGDFLELWIDGLQLKRDVSGDGDGDYFAKEGSTIITVYGQTLGRLDHNSNHVIAGEFKAGGAAKGEQYRAAQYFIISVVPRPKKYVDNDNGDRNNGDRNNGNEDDNGGKNIDDSAENSGENDENNSDEKNGENNSGENDESGGDDESIENKQNSENDGGGNDESSKNDESGENNENNSGGNSSESARLINNSVIRGGNTLETDITIAAAAPEIASPQTPSAADSGFAGSGADTTVLPENPIAPAAPASISTQTPLPAATAADALPQTNRIPLYALGAASICGGLFAGTKVVIKWMGKKKAK